MHYVRTEGIETTQQMIDNVRTSSEKYQQWCSIPVQFSLRWYSSVFKKCACDCGKSMKINALLIWWQISRLNGFGLGTGVYRIRNTNHCYRYQSALSCASVRWCSL